MILFFNNLFKNKYKKYILKLFFLNFFKCFFTIKYIEKHNLINYLLKKNKNVNKMH